MKIQDEKIKRLNKLLAIVQKAGKCDKDALYGEISFTMGISRKTFEDYLIALKSKGVIIEDNQIFLE